MGYYLKIGNTKHFVTNENGVEKYDPPLADHVEKLFKKNSGQVIASGKCPSIRTVSTFHAGRKTIREQFGDDEPMLKHFAKKYKKQTGRTLNANDVYMSQLAGEMLDPNAVVTSSEGDEKVQRLIREKRARHAKEESTFIPLAEDLVQDKMLQYRQAGDTSDAVELRQKVIDKHGQKPL